MKSQCNFQRAGKTCPLYSFYKFNVIIILVLILPIFLFTQEDEENLYQLFQRENTEETVRQFFTDFKIPFKSDTAIIFILPPMGCPRCEGLIKPIISYIQKLNVQSDIIVLAVYNKRKAVEHYLKRRLFNSDYDIITDDKFLNSFLLSVEPLRVPFITKFNIKTGKLINSESLLGFSADSTNTAKFIFSREMPQRALNKFKEVNKQVKIDSVELSAKILSDFNMIKKLKLLDSDEFPLSSALYYEVSPSGSYLSIVDDLTSQIYIFNLITGRIFNVLYPDSAEEKKFIKISEAVYQYMKQNNIIHSMYFNHSFYNDTSLIITASLPKVVMEGENIGYYNKAVFILKDINKNSGSVIINFSDHPDTLFTLSHTAAQFLYKDNLIFVPLEKGWPATGSKILHHDINKLENPFEEEFYKFAPQFAVYNVDGSFLTYFGKLDSSIEKLKLGYYANSPIVKKIRSNYWIADRFSGKIVVYSNLQFGMPSDEITIFKNSEKIPNINFLEKPLDYIIETFKNNFHKQIVDFAVKDSVIYTLISENNLLSFIIINENTKSKSVKYIPHYRDGMKLTKAFPLLRISEINMRLCAILEKSDETFYVEYEVR
jgi:hypothetical protein